MDLKQRLIMKLIAIVIISLLFFSVVKTHCSLDPQSRKSQAEHQSRSSALIGPICSDCYQALLRKKLVFRCLSLIPVPHGYHELQGPELCHWS